jgi:pyrroline-5-carboxylate reductase
VRETFHGSLALLDAHGRTPSALLAEIASPGSASERAIAVLGQGAIAERAERAMQAAIARAVELRDIINSDVQSEA